MSIKPFRVGCLGARRIFKEEHLPAYISLASAGLAAIYDPDGERAEPTRQRYFSLLKEAARSAESVNVDLCDSPEDLISGVERIDICSPARYHVRY